MHPQLRELVDEFEKADARLGQLASVMPESAWSRRAHPDRWSAAECIEHLILTAQAYLPVIDEALARARALARREPRRYRRDAVGWLLWRVMGPPVRVVRVRTAAAFVPAPGRSRAEQLEIFARLQEDQVARVRAAEGLPIDAVRVVSPFDPRTRYNLYSCLSILPRHQHRHLWQAERVWDALASPESPGAGPASCGRTTAPRR